jgi:hypothetical protein
MTMIDTADSRFPKAVAIADQAGQWLKCRAADGRKAYGVPSQRTPDRYYRRLTRASGAGNFRRYAAGAPTRLAS